MKLRVYSLSLFLLVHGPLIADTIEATKPDRLPGANQIFTECYAVWYRVPIDSLARRRAKPTEFTAAHNRLPLGTLVRVTRLSNDCSVLVRITDRGITNRRANIDICWEAAKELGMLREGLSRVRLEIIPEIVVPVAPEPAQIPAH